MGQAPGSSVGTEVGSAVGPSPIWGPGSSSVNEETNTWPGIRAPLRPAVQGCIMKRMTPPGRVSIDHGRARCTIAFLSPPRIIFTSH